MSSMLISLLILVILLRGWLTHVSVYEAFVEGATDGLHTAIRLTPALCAMMLMLSAAQASGLTALLSAWFSPLLQVLHLPPETSSVLFMRPLSGSGALAALEQLYRETGVDSRASLVASVLMGSSETIFYTMTVYLAATKLKKLPHVIPISLISMLVSAMAAGWIIH